MIVIPNTSINRKQIIQDGQFPVTPLLSVSVQSLVFKKELASFLLKQFLDIQTFVKEIFVEDQSVGIVSSDKEVEELKEQLKKKYYGDKAVEVEFGKKVEVKDVFAKEDDLISMDKLVQKCTTTTPKSITYTVQAGDTLSGIASKYNTSIDGIISANQGFTNQTVLQLGQVINANINEPLLPLTIIEKAEKTDTKAANGEDEAQQ